MNYPIHKKWLHLIYIIHTFDKLLHILNIVILYKDNLEQSHGELLELYFNNLIYNFYKNNNRCLSIVLNTHYYKICGNKLRKKINKQNYLCGKHINNYKFY